MIKSKGYYLYSNIYFISSDIPLLKELCEEFENKTKVLELIK
jgi:hypothetical protein